ncbi:hypothetical protein CRENBAI_023786 [Crenichthys baileyi]|uniref:Uncharacterized protein n=1 Tax=Crenichthys baileyi TaxID=28760 RepID=A0AAV9SNE9_9TELE
MVTGTHIHVKFLPLMRGYCGLQVILLSSVVVPVASGLVSLEASLPVSARFLSKFLWSLGQDPLWGAVSSRHTLQSSFMGSCGLQAQLLSWFLWPPGPVPFWVPVVSGSRSFVSSCGLQADLQSSFMGSCGLQPQLLSGVLWPPGPAPFWLPVVSGSSSFVGSCGLQADLQALLWVAVASWEIS